MRAKDHQPLPHPSMCRQPVLLDEDLVRAAEILESEAACLRASHAVRGRWVLGTEEDVLAKASYHEYLRIARRFRRVAGTL